ncbi:hypothetical protein LTR33_011969, partial [Friedmanniomyces endolithicus]
ISRHTLYYTIDTLPLHSIDPRARQTTLPTSKQRNMATPPVDGLEAEKSSSSPPLLGKRKRESDEDSDNKNNAENTLFIPDENDMSLLV